MSDLYRYSGLGLSLICVYKANLLLNYLNDFSVDYNISFFFSVSDNILITVFNNISM